MSFSDSRQIPSSKGDKSMQGEV